MWERHVKRTASAWILRNGITEVGNSHTYICWVRWAWILKFTSFQNCHMDTAKEGNLLHSMYVKMYIWSYVMFTLRLTHLNLSIISTGYQTSSCVILNGELSTL